MKIRFLIKAVLAVFPSFVKRPAYRLLFGYQIGKRVKIGISIIDVTRCSIEDDVSIGHLNLFVATDRLRIGDHSRIGHMNVIRGGKVVDIGRYCDIMRLNEINSIPDPDVVNEVDPVFTIGDGSVIVASHKIDFTDRVEIGKRVILGGRNSSLWTHNRQRTKAIRIGDHSYVGSEIRIAPGGEVPSDCIVGIGAVITKPLRDKGTLIGGVPAKSISRLDEDALFLTEYKTRPDLPDDI